MPAWIDYLLKVNLSIALFYGGYYLLLKALTFYVLNRCYFITGLLFSFLYPLIDLSTFFSEETYVGKTGTPLITWNDLATKVQAKDYLWDQIMVLFLFVTLVLSLKFLVRLISLSKIHNNSTTAVYGNYQYRQVWLPVYPFSFWKSIYLNPTLHSESDLRGILEHESEHVKQLHTLDVLLVEIASICCWFNPAIWLTRLAIKDNLEFLTDRHVIQSGIDKKKYQYSLINLSCRTMAPELSNHFNFNVLKRRIIMMNKRKSSQLHLGRYVFIVPAITISALTFTVTKAYQHQQASLLPTVQDSILATAKTVQERQGTFDGAKNVTSQESAKQKVKLTFKSEHIEPLYIVDGEPLAAGEGIDNVESHNIASINVLKGSSATALYGSRGKNGAILITTKKNMSKEFNDTSTTPMQIGSDNIGEAPTKTTGANSESKADEVIVHPESRTYILDGHLVDKEYIESLDKTAIESVDVTKDSKNGAGTIRITTKKNK